MTYLTHNGQLRAESDAEVIATLKRKGWTETDAPETPEPSAREAARANLRAAWNALASWIRGPFHTQFLAVQNLLDAGDDDAAEALITYAVPPADYDTEQLSAFATFKTEFSAAIAALPNP
jgi:hypothetical protein